MLVALFPIEVFLLDGFLLFETLSRARASFLQRFAVCGVALGCFSEDVTWFPEQRCVEIIKKEVLARSCS